MDEKKSEKMWYRYIVPKSCEALEWGALGVGVMKLG